MDPRGPLIAGRERAFTLVELMLVVAIVAALASVGTVNFLAYKEKVRGTQVIVDLRTMATEIDGYEVSTGALPDSLADVGLDAMLDRWGNPYEYTRVETSPIGKLRKDKFLVPINSDYDLYSRGPDGTTVAPLTGKPARDDIIRASNGSYYGPASAY